MTEWANAINKYSINYYAIIVCGRSHGNNYTLKHHYDIKDMSSSQIRGLYSQICDAEYVVFGDMLGRDISHPWSGKKYYISVMQNFFNEIASAESLLNKKFILFHPGSDYRTNFRIQNRARGFHKILYAPDLYRLSKTRNGIDTVIWPISTSGPKRSMGEMIRIIKNRFRKGQPLIILHCPSNKAMKGTETIREIVGRLIKSYPRFSYVEMTKQPHEKIMKYKITATIYIDQFIPNIGGFGVSSVESLMVGNIVLSSVNNITNGCISEASPETKELPIIPTGTDHRSFIKSLTNLLAKSDKELLDISIKNYEWSIKNLSGHYVTKRFESLC